MGIMDVSTVQNVESSSILGIYTGRLQIKDLKNQLRPSSIPMGHVAKAAPGIIKITFHIMLKDLNKMEYNLLHSFDVRLSFTSIPLSFQVTLFPFITFP